MLPNRKWRPTQYKRIDGAIDSNFSDWSLTNAMDHTFARIFLVGEGKNTGLWYWCVNEAPQSKYIKENAGYSKTAADAKAECEARIRLNEEKNKKQAVNGVA